MNQHGKPVLGIDIGRVIIGAAEPSGRADSSFLSGSEERALAMPPSDDAFAVIEELTAAFEGRVWLVSKCGPRIQRLTLRWLSHHAFYEQTGVPSEQVRFCLKRPEKADHCRAIGATHFIDDRLDVLSHLRGMVPRLFWFGHGPSCETTPPWVERTLDWRSVREAILTRVCRRDPRTEQARGA